MTYTLKVDWTVDTVRLAHRAVSGNGKGKKDIKRPAKELGELARLYAGRDGTAKSTHKFGWTQREINAVVLALADFLRWLEGDALRARDSRPGPSYEAVAHDQAAAWQALGEIARFRGDIALVKAVEANRGMSS